MLGHLGQFEVGLGQIFIDLRVIVVKEGTNMGYSKALVSINKQNDMSGQISKRHQTWTNLEMAPGHLLRNVNGSYGGVSKHLLLSAHQVLEPIHRDVIIARQVDLYVMSKEIVDLTFITILASEFLATDLSKSQSISRNLLIG